MKKQQGSAHVIVVVVLVIALIGALGYIFLQTLNKKDQSKDEVSTATTAKVDGKEETAQTPSSDFVTYKDAALGFSFDYPKEWGNLDETTTQSGDGRIGANGENVKALVDAKGVKRVAIYTEASFSAMNHAGYTIRYQAGKPMGTDAGTEDYYPINPITGTVAYAHDLGDAEFAAYNLFFKSKTSVVYVSAGDSKDIQNQIAKA